MSGDRRIVRALARGCQWVPEWAASPSLSDDIHRAIDAPNMQRAVFDVLTGRAVQRQAGLALLAPDQAHKSRSS